MNKVLVTGGAGFIGSFVSKELLKNGYQPLVYDAYIHYLDPLKSNYQNYLKKRFNGIEDNVIKIRGDVRDKSFLQKIILEHSPKKIIHIAALPIADLANEYSEEAESTIIGGTVNILEIIRNLDFVDRFVYISSSMIYGDFQYTPADEEHPKNPKEIYGATKYSGEIITQAFGRRFGIEYTIVRPSAVYGPTDVNGRVIQIFIENALNNKRIQIHGTNTCLDFTYVKDVAKGILLCAISPEAKNETFNITRGEGKTLLDLVNILKIYFPDIKVEIEKVKNYRPKRGALDISKAEKVLGYKPGYSLEEGIKEYLQFMKGDLII